MIHTHTLTIKNFNHKRDSVSDYLQRVHTAPCVGWELLSGWFEGIKNLYDILHYLPIFVCDPLLLCVMCYVVSRRQWPQKEILWNLRRRTDSMEDFENYTVATLLDNRYKNHFFQDREKRGCFHLLATLLTTLMCLSVFIHSKTLQIRG